MGFRGDTRAFAEVVEVLPGGRLSWASLAHGERLPSGTGVSADGRHLFCVDEELIYEAFAHDFGPLNLGMTYRYCKLLDAKLKSSNLDLVGRPIVHCCANNPQRRANSVFLICAYQVLILGTSPRSAWAPFASLRPTLLPFRDALTGPCNFALTVLDCLEGLAKAVELGWFSMSTFDVATYERLLCVDNIDGTWVVPNKFFAFAGPMPSNRDANGYLCYTPEDCAGLFRQIGVGLVVRLNRKQYERKRFMDAGLSHLDLYFADGSCPTPEIISRFLWVCEHEPGGVAVHCKAGLGRTCTLIGLYSMKHFRFPARALIGWLRVARPGSVLGPQQQFLVDMQEEMFSLGAAAKVQASISPGLSPSGHGRQQRQCQTPSELGDQGSAVRPHTPQQRPSSSSSQSAHAAGQLAIGGQARRSPSKLGSLSFAEQFVDIGQGERLCGAKRGVRPSSSGSSGGSSPLSPSGASTPPTGAQRFGGLGASASAPTLGGAAPASRSPTSYSNAARGDRGAAGWSCVPPASGGAGASAPFVPFGVALPRLHAKPPFMRQGSMSGFLVSGSAAALDGTGKPKLQGDSWGSAAAVRAGSQPFMN